jgi:hypothetical protein
VRYVIEGSVRRGGNRLRITAQLIDATTGHHLWAERYDRSLADLFDIQDEITRSVAASVEFPVFLAEHHSAKSRSSSDFKARDLVARAIGRIYDQIPEAIAEASDCVEEAIRIDPLTPRAHQMRGAIFQSRMHLGEIAVDAASVGQALELARTALRVARTTSGRIGLWRGHTSWLGGSKRLWPNANAAWKSTPISRGPWGAWQNASRPLDAPRKRLMHADWLCNSVPVTQTILGTNRTLRLHTS